MQKQPTHYDWQPDNQIKKVTKSRQANNITKRNIPNSPILDQPSNYNVMLTSLISFLRASSIANGLDYVLNLRK